MRRAMGGLGLTHDIIVVDDGSTDGTADAAESHGVRVIRLPENGGYGAALKAGIPDRFFRLQNARPVL